jgi:hypothetical protein
LQAQDTPADHPGLAGSLPAMLRHWPIIPSNSTLRPAGMSAILPGIFPTRCCLSSNLTQNNRFGNDGEARLPINLTEKSNEPTQDIFKLQIMFRNSSKKTGHQYFN